MINLPEKFIENMKKQLPENEWEAFFGAYASKPVKGVRINPLKGGRYALNGILGEQVPWEKNGFYTPLDKLGKSPFHFAGLFYSQEPSAMSAAPLLDVQAGERVLDLCSAPGGKGTQLACVMDGKGVILLNEPVLSRAKILSGNVERMGITNAVVVSETPEKLAEKFPAYFDKILVDAPCSGEGMFRKNTEEALAEWSEENVALCSARQKRILVEAVKMLKTGGRLVYSTCTFAPQEDEAQTAWLESTYPQMRLLSQEKLYPHKIKGEGHFVALFEKVGEAQTTHVKEMKPFISKESERAFLAFEKEFFKTPRRRNLHEAGGVLYDLPENVFDWKGLSVLRVGLRLGEVKNGRFEPSHSLALASKKEDVKNAVDLPETDLRVEKYLRGETIEATQAPNGWCAVCVAGFPIGLGKVVNGVVKNHIPKGLRIQ